MSDEGSNKLNETLGQLEDELQQIKSAKEQVDEVVSASVELSEGLERLIGSTKELIQRSNDRTQEAAEALSKEAGRLAGSSNAIEKASLEAVEAVRTQASSAQTTLEDATGKAVEALGEQAERLEKHTTAMELAVEKTADTVRKQASDSQEAIEQTATKAVEQMSSDIADLMKKAVSSLNGELEDAKGNIDAAVNSLNDATANIGKGCESLAALHETVSEDNERWGSETKALIEETQRRLADVDARVSTIKEIDVDSLTLLVREVRDAEAADVDDFKKQLTTLKVMVGLCVIVCIATLVLLLGK